jgi:hypothetical protein
MHRMGAVLYRSRGYRGAVGHPHAVQVFGMRCRSGAGSGAGHFRTNFDHPRDGGP